MSGTSYGACVLHVAPESFAGGLLVFVQDGDLIGLDVPARKLDCPLLVLWGEKGVVHRFFDPIADWKSVANDVRGKALPSGHHLAGEVPDATYAELLAFFRN